MGYKTGIKKNDLTKITECCPVIYLIYVMSCLYLDTSQNTSPSSHFKAQSIYVRQAFEVLVCKIINI